MDAKATPTIVNAEGDEEVKASGETAATGGGEVVGAHETEIKYVEMPENYVRWVLEQEIAPVFSLDKYPLTSEVSPQKLHDEQLELLASARESLLASRDEFAKYQAWVREEYEREGRVLVPEADHPQISEEQEELNRLALQAEVDRLFAQAAEEFERDYPELPGLIAEAKRKAAENELLGGVVGKAEDENPIAATAEPNCD